MSKHLQRDLENLQRDLVTQAAAVEEVVYSAVRALRARDVTLARKLLDGDSRIDAEENRIEEECLKVLALHQPVAVDLRRIVAVLKINTDLERMADLAVNIAERAVALAGALPISIPAGFQRMADLTTRMVREALDSFVHLDPQLARGVCRLDNEVDQLNTDIIVGLIDLMRQSPTAVEAGLSLFSATRHLERIADHATNIAEDAVYLVEGMIIRHRPSAIEPEPVRARP